MKTRKQLGLAVALLLLSAPVLAEWQEIERFEDGMRVFVDPQTARRDGDLAEVRHLVRWGEPQVGEGHPPYLSTVVLTRYDCVAKLERYQGSTSYAGTQGNGAEVLSDEREAESWYTISDASMEETLWKIACAAH